MIPEVALLDVLPSKTDEFERTFAAASAIISSMPGYLSHELQRCLETPHRYVLLVLWRRLEDHTEGSAVRRDTGSGDGCSTTSTILFPWCGVSSRFTRAEIRTPGLR